MRSKRVKIGVWLVVLVIAGVLIAAGPFTIFHVCQSGNGMEMHCPGDGTGMMMACQKTASAERVIGIAIAVAGCLAAVVGTNKGILLFGILEMGLAMVALLIPTVLIGVCDGVHLPCHAVTRPALIVLSVTAFGAALTLTATAGVRWLHQKNEVALS